MLVTYQTACERRETNNYWHQIIMLGDALPESSPVQFAFEVKKKQKYKA